MFAQVTGAGLEVYRKTPGQYRGKSQGISIPIGHIGNYPIRYHVGTTHGSVSLSSTEEAVIDTGNFYVTNQRIIFEGSKKTIECKFNKLLSVHHDTDKGETTFSVSNRQTPTIILYGKDAVIPIVFRIELALAHYKGAVPEIVGRYEEMLASIIKQKPMPDNINH